MAKIPPQIAGVLSHTDEQTSVHITLVMQPLLLTVPQVAQVLNFSRSKVYELITIGDLPVMRFGKSVRVRVSTLELWLNLQEEKAGRVQLEEVA